MGYELVKEVLQDLNDVPDIGSSAVVTVDGLAVVTSLQSNIDEDRLSAMAAAVISLGERVSREVMQSLQDHTIIHTDNGFMLLFQVNESLVLTVVTVKDAKLGLVLFESKKAIERIRELFKE